MKRESPPLWRAALLCLAPGTVLAAEEPTPAVPPPARPAASPETANTPPPHAAVGEQSTVARPAVPPVPTLPPVATPPATPQDPAREVEETMPSWRSRAWRFSGDIGVLSLPRPLNLEALAAYARPGDARWDLFALGILFGLLPPHVIEFGGPSPKPTDTLSILQVGVHARWYAWRYAFVGANFGWQSWRDDATNFTHPFVYTTSAMFITPRIGVLYRLPRLHWEFGADVGATFRLTHSTTSSPYDGDSTAGKLTNGFGIPMIPEVTFARVGYTF